ncbi:hypothetical protein V6N12_063444 [Hibiscus sabdariffa]|uniref:Protein kinase domain-containing protein n=1 Tax=Hibiscus sabdariffa TaxID=183260 RepID=A0ABR2FC51_9ROSI
MKILFILTSRGKKHPTRELTFGSVILASISGVNSATAQQQHQMLPLQKSHRFGKAAASQNKLPTSSFPLRSNHDDSARFVSIGVQGLSGMVHGNACLESVVMQTLDRKLHAFDVLSEYDGAKWNCYRTIVANSQSSSSIGNGCGLKAPPWAIDSWGLGCLIYEIFSGMKLGETEELWDTSSIPKPLLPDYQRLLSSLPSRSLKDSVERDTFFRKLPTLAEQLHCQIVLNKIFPLLTSALEYGSAAAHALNALLKTGQMGHDLLNSSKGKSLDQAPVAAANSARPVTATTSAASSGLVIGAKADGRMSLSLYRIL